jgi:hypothetical protein
LAFILCRVDGIADGDGKKGPPVWARGAPTLFVGAFSRVRECEIFCVRATQR